MELSLALLPSAAGSGTALRAWARFPRALVLGGEGNCCSLVSTADLVAAAACPLLLRVTRAVGAGVAAMGA